MIGRLTGQLLKVTDNTVLLDVGGVGYEIEVPDGGQMPLASPEVSPEALSASTSAARSAPAGKFVLHTHLVVREDAQLLYGFVTVTERDLFRNLIRINGVGPKMGLAILGTYSAGDLARCVTDDDYRALTKVPGVGKKTAERLLVELRNRQDLLPDEPQESATPSPQRAQRAVVDEVEQALVALGYKPQYATQVVQQVAQDPDTADNTQAMLRAALQFLGQKSEGQV